MHKIKSAALFLAVVLGFTVCLADESKAEDVSVNATLSSDTTEVGQPVELDLEIQGAASAEVPGQISANGLSIMHNSGPNIQVKWINGNVSKSVGHTYTVQADQAGKFTIPAVTIDVNGQKLSTNPLSLTVTAGGGGNTSGSPATDPKADSNSKFAFAEIVVPKQSAYVGEAIPAQFFVYFDPKGRYGQIGTPDIKCEGFTIEKLSQPVEKDGIEKNGKRYISLCYTTAITPVKSGKLSLGPAELQFVAQLPVQRQPQRRQQPGGVDDFFNDDMFNNMVGLSQPQQCMLKANAIDFEVKPLPKEGQPANFSGAVGIFSLTTDAAPLKLNVGDPITLKYKISGRGNFDRVRAPSLVDDTGWHTYPPSAKFTADDDIGISGSKVFEIAAIPNEKKTKLPEVEFSYFDPVSEKYATLKGDLLPISVEGQSPAPPVAQATPASQPAATPDAAKNTNDIHYLLTGSSQWVTSFAPLFRQRIFWKTQTAPMAALLAFVAFQVRRRKGRDAIARQLAARRREQNDLMKILQREDTDQTAFYGAAIRYIQLAAARTTHQSPESIGQPEAIASCPLDAATSDGVQSIFNAHGELSYAGAAVTRQTLPEARRREVLETLREFEHASA